MNIREMLKKDFDIDVLISGGGGKRDDPYVIDACDADAAALTQWNFLRGLALGRGTFWRIEECAACDAGRATEVVKVEQVFFGETEVNTLFLSFYFDTRAVSGKPHTKHPLIAWRGPAGTLVLPRDLGWMQFAGVTDNPTTGNEFDYSIHYNGPGAKLTVIVYSSERTQTSNAQMEELGLAVGQMQQVHPGLEDRWPAFGVGPFAMKSFISPEGLTSAGIAVMGGHFVKLRLTHFADVKMMEMMQETISALSTCVLQGSAKLH